MLGRSLPVPVLFGAGYDFSSVGVAQGTFRTAALDPCVVPDLHLLNTIYLKVLRPRAVTFSAIG